MLRALPHRIIRSARIPQRFKTEFIQIAKMATTAPADKSPIPAGTSASGQMVPAKATGKKAKDGDGAPSYPLEVSFSTDLKLCT